MRVKTAVRMERGTRGLGNGILGRVKATRNRVKGAALTNKQNLEMNRSARSGSGPNASVATRITCEQRSMNGPFVCMSGMLERRKADLATACSERRIVYARGRGRSTQNAVWPWARRDCRRSEQQLLAPPLTRAAAQRRDLFVLASLYLSRYNPGPVSKITACFLLIEIRALIIAIIKSSKTVL